MNSVVEIIDISGEGSGEGMEGSGYEPETVEQITEQEIGNFYYFLRVHQCILPLAVLFLMYQLWGRRGRALETGRKIDERLAKEWAAHAEKMSRIENNFIKSQVSQMKSQEAKKDE